MASNNGYTVKYIGERYVPVFYENPDDNNSPQWRNDVAYEPLTIVTNNNFTYTSKRHVPVGIDIFNTKYWVLTGQFDAQVNTLYELLQSTIDTLEQNTFGEDWHFYAFGYQPADSGTADGQHTTSYKQTQDCNVIVSPNDKVLLIDSGFELGNNNWQSAFTARGIERIDAVVISHFHLDHAGGILDMRNYLTFDSDTVWYLPEKLTAVDAEDSPAIYTLESQILSFITSTGGTIIRPTEGQSFNFDGANLVFYNTHLDTWRENGHIKIYNNTSVCTMVEIGTQHIFYSGDAEYKLQGELAKKSSIKYANIVKFSHHGANRSFEPLYYYKMHPSATFANNGQDFTNQDVASDNDREIQHMLQAVSGENYMYNKMGIPVYATSADADHILHFTVNRKSYQFYTDLYKYQKNVPVALLGCLYDTETTITSDMLTDWYGAEQAQNYKYLEGRNIFQAPSINGVNPNTLSDLLNSLPDNGIFMCRTTGTLAKVNIFDDGASTLIIYKTSSSYYRNAYKDNASSTVESYAVLDFCTGQGLDSSFADGLYGVNPICTRVVANKVRQGGEWVFSSQPLSGDNFIFFKQEITAGTIDHYITRNDFVWSQNRDFGIVASNGRIYPTRTAVVFEVMCRGWVTGSADIKVTCYDTGDSVWRNAGRIRHGSSGADHVTNIYVWKPASSGSGSLMKIEGTCENDIVDFQCLIKPLAYNYNKDVPMLNY